MNIISGGQTGVDRAALDVALKQGIECGGWCPAGRLDEFGRIPDRYPLKELKRESKQGRSPDRPGGPANVVPWKKSGIFAARTWANVKDSDGTIIIYSEQSGGGTAYTIECCKYLRRPHELIGASQISSEEAAKLIGDFVRTNKIGVLNVAGPRQSDWPEGYEYAFRALDIFLTSCSHRPVGGHGNDGS